MSPNFYFKFCRMKVPSKFPFCVYLLYSECYIKQLMEWFHLWLLESESESESNILSGTLLSRTRFKIFPIFFFPAWMKVFIEPEHSYGIRYFMKPYFVFCQLWCSTFIIALNIFLLISIYNTEIVATTKNRC